MAALFRSSRQLHSLRSSTSTQQHISSRILQLPSSLRSRAFHASPRSQIIEEGINLSHTVLQTLHSTTGLPWAYTLPLFAVAVRTTLFLPLSIYVRRLNQKQISLQPVLQAWGHILKKETIREVGHAGPQTSQAMFLTKQRAKRIEIFKRWKCQNWKNYTPLLQIPVFLSIMEAIRQMCGAPTGLLGMMLRKNPETDVADRIIEMEPSLALEGALWFPDLLAADPQLVLPFVLSATILLNIFGTRFRAEGIKSKFQDRLEKALGIMALAIGPVMLNVPSGMLIYWIGSSSSAFIQSRILDIAMPIKQPVAPCKPKRPWRTNLRAKAIAAGKTDVEHIEDVADVVEGPSTSPDPIVSAPKAPINRRHRA